MQAPTARESVLASRRHKSWRSYPNAVTYIVPPQLNRRNSKQMVLRQRLVLPRRSSRRAGGNENCRHPALFRRVKHLLERFNGRVTMGRLPLALYPFANPLETLVADPD